MVFINFLGTGNIPDQDGSLNILTCLDFMTGFGIAADTRMKECISDQAARWAFGNLFVPFGVPKIIVVDADGIFSGIFRKTFQ